MNTSGSRKQRGRPTNSFKAAVGAAADKSQLTFAGGGPNIMYVGAVRYLLRELPQLNGARLRMP